VIAQFVRQKQCRDRFRQAGDVLGDVDERNGEIARGVENRKAERAHQNDIAGGGAALLPEPDRPGEQRDGQHQRHPGVQDAQLFEIAQAAAARDQLAPDGRVEPGMLVAQAAECANQRHVADHVDHLAVDDGRLVGEIVMQRLAGGGQTKHGNHHGPRKHDQRRRHRKADRSDQRDRGDGRNAWRQHIPDEHVFDREHRVRGRGDAAGQHARQPVGKIARRVAGQVAKHVAPEVAGYSHEGKTRCPTRDAPKKIIGSDQRHEQTECQPYVSRKARPRRQAVDQIFHAVLRAYRTGNRSNNGSQDDEMRNRSPAQVTQDKVKRPMRISR